MVNWGIIGCGNVTEVKSGPAFNLVDQSQVVAVMRRNAQLAKDYAKRHNVSKWYSNADDLINDSDLNAIYIATPPNSHAEYSIKAMKAGKPVYVEKPMALNYSECKEMLAVSEETGVPLFVAYYRRALPGFLKVKSLIDENQIGDIHTINIQLYKSPSEEELNNNPGWRVMPEISGGGHFIDLASHQLDYLDFLFGPISEVKSFVSNQAGLYTAEDNISAIFTFEGNITCNGSWCFSANAENNRDIIEIVGNKGAIQFSTFNFTPIKLITSNGIQEFEYSKPTHVQIYLIKQVVENLLGISESPSTGLSASRTSRVLDKVVFEYYKEQGIINMVK